MRLDNWPILLSMFLQKKKDEPFKWGENDCVMFVGQAVEALTGKDHYSKYKGYQTELGALAVMKENGGIEGLISKALGNPHLNWKAAKRGDIVILKTPQITAGVVDDSGQRIVCVSEKGIFRFPLSRAIKVWSY